MSGITLTGILYDMVSLYLYQYQFRTWLKQERCGNQDLLALGFDCIPCALNSKLLENSLFASMARMLLNIPNSEEGPDSEQNVLLCRLYTISLNDCLTHFAV